MEITEEIMSRSEKLQEECSKHISVTFPKTKKVVSWWESLLAITSGKSNRYDSCKDVWGYIKLAELELRIEKLENQK